MGPPRRERAQLGEVARRCGLALLEVGDEARATASLRRASPVAVLVFLRGAAGGLPGRLKALRPGVPVLVGLRTARPDTLLAALEIGADDVVRLPVSAVELAARLSATLRRLRQEEASLAPGDDGPIRLGELAIDRAGRAAHRGDQRLPLTDTEFELLAALAGSAGRPLSRERLLNRLCRFDYEIDSRTIDVHVRNLRRKVEPDPSQPSLIRAVPGVGYCVAEPSD